MTIEIRNRRNSPAMFAVRAAEHVTGIVPALIVWLSIRVKWPVVLGLPVDAIFALVGGVIVLSLIVDWWMTRFSVGPDGVTFATGLVFRRSTSLAWSEVASVQTSRSAAGRALGCSRVLIGIGAQSKANLVIEAVPEAVATEIEDLFEAYRARPASRPQHPAVASATESAGHRPDAVDREEGHPAGEDDLIYRIRPRDYFMLSVTYGQFLLVVPFLFGLYENVATLLPWAAATPDLPDGTAALWVLAGTVLVLAVPVAIGFGTTVAWLRYRSFEVRLRGSVFAMTGGLVSAESRQVSRSQVAGIKIQQNPLMRATGHARLNVVARQSGERIGANVVFPAARLAFLRNEIRSHFPAYAAAADESHPVRRSVTWGLLTVNAVVLTAAGVAASSLRPVTAGALMVVLALVLLIASNYCWVAVRLDPDGAVLSFRRGFLWVTHYVVPLDSVYFVHSHQIAAHRVSIGAVCLGIYDSRAVRLWVPAHGTALTDQFIESTTSAAMLRGKEKMA